MISQLWMKTSINGMMTGNVSRRWAKKHRPRRYCEVEIMEEKQQQ